MNQSSPTSASRQTTTVVKAALALLKLGYWPVLIHPNPPDWKPGEKSKKNPIGDAWGLERWSAEKIERTAQDFPGAGVGIAFGPGRGPGGSWPIDLEGDGLEAADSLARLLGGEVPETPSWGSYRGGHTLFIADGERLLKLLAACKARQGKGPGKVGVYHLDELPGLEFRVGGTKPDGVVKQTQSVVPPTVGDDGNPRAWTITPRTPIAPLPEAAYAFLERLAAEKAQKAKPAASKSKGKARRRPGESYAMAALRDECDAVAVEPENNRNIRLNIAAYNLGQLVGAKVLARSEVETALSESARRAGLEEQETIKTIKSGLDAGEAQPRDLSGTGRYGDPPSQNGDGDADPRPVIFVTTEEAEVNDQAVKVLASAPGLYQRNFRLVAVARDSRPKQGADIKRAEGTPVIRPVQAAKLREDLTRIIQWQAFKPDRNGKARRVNAHPPAWCMAAILAREEWPDIPYLLGVVEAPTLRADGSILDEPGYDRRTGLLYVPNGSFPPVLANPSRDDARTAADSLFELVKDFPFKTGHKASWLAALLTPLARFLIDGPCPLFLLEANTSGAGKSKLCDIIGMVVSGREMTRTGYYHDPVEMDKQITATALAGDRTVFLDNITNGGELGNSSLDRALTGRTYRGRVLGKLEMTPDLDLICVFYATGNNLSLCGDTPRRILPGRLESPLEHPEERDDFTIKGCQCGCGGDLIDHARRDRGRLHVAALTILRAYIQAGKPLQPLKPMDFPAWSSLIRNAVYWATGLDPAVGRADLRKADSHHEHCAAFVEAWHEVQTERRVRAMTTADLVRELAAGKQSKACEMMRAAISELWPKLKPGDLPSSGTIGKTIGAIRDKPFGPLKFQEFGSEDRRKLWAVVTIPPADEFDEDNEFISNSTRESCADNSQRDNCPTDNCQRNSAGGSAKETHQTHQTHREADPPAGAGDIPFARPEGWADAWVVTGGKGKGEFDWRVDDPDAF
jgi:hypothetical protein